MLSAPVPTLSEKRADSTRHGCWHAPRSAHNGVPCTRPPASASKRLLSVSSTLWRTTSEILIRSCHSSISMTWTFLLSCSRLFSSSQLSLQIGWCAYRSKPVRRDASIFKCAKLYVRYRGGGRPNLRSCEKCAKILYTTAKLIVDIFFFIEIA